MTSQSPRGGAKAAFQKLGEKKPPHGKSYRNDDSKLSTESPRSVIFDKKPPQ